MKTNFKIIKISSGNYGYKQILSNPFSGQMNEKAEHKNKKNNNNKYDNIKNIVKHNNNKKQNKYDYNKKLFDIYR